MSNLDYSDAAALINKAKEIEGDWAEIARALSQANTDGYKRGLEDMAKAAKEVAKAQSGADLNILKKEEL